MDQKENSPCSPGTLSGCPGCLYPCPAADLFGHTAIREKNHSGRIASGAPLPVDAPALRLLPAGCDSKVKRRLFAGRYSGFLPRITETV
ncbi:hypothetical protein ASZ90_009438 [hydrocarbon metagenome]|uniref:Uncharacterized protein n=1 Tax=hydrocarbon metagenome TaxID=938273 RepID=A0A0W8FJ91_9ZZZZ